MIRILPQSPCRIAWGMDVLATPKDKMVQGARMGTSPDVVTTAAVAPREEQLHKKSRFTSARRR